MPKKRVGVSLRKPSQSQAPETVPPSAAASQAAATPAQAEEIAGAEFVASVASDAAVESEPSTLVMSKDQGASERPSDIVALKKGPAPGEARAIEAFVNGAAEALERAATEIPPARLAEALRRGPEGYRELVLYLPEKLAQELALHCVEHDLDMSRLVAGAIEQHLTGLSVAAPAAVAEPVGRRRAEDVSPANEGLLSLAARVLMGELAAWARAVWARRRASGAVGAAAAG